MSSRRYIGYCLTVALALIAVKLWVGTHVLTTAAFDDDHEFLNRSVYLLRGDPNLTDYPFSKVPYGPLYPLALSPWTLFADPSTRLTVVFVINAVFSAIAVFFGSLIVFRLTNTASLLVPLCLAAFGPLFQFSYYAKSENLVFPLTAVVGWLAVDFEQTCKNPFKLILLLLLVLMLPLVRVPGLAVVPGLFVLLWLNRKHLFQHRVLLLAAGLSILLPAVSYYAFYRVTLDSPLEAEYLLYIWKAVSNIDHWLFPLSLALAQTGYLLVSTGYWVLPVFVVVALQLRAFSREPYRQRLVNYLTYAGVSGGVFVCFALVHLLQKLKFSDPDFIYGRYDDPAGFLLLIGGLAGVLILESPTRFQGFLLKVVAPFALCFVLTKIGGTKWIPVNQCGLAIFATGPVPALPVVMAIVLATLLNQLTDYKRWYPPVALLFLLTFSLLTDWNGMEYTITRARRGAHSVEAAEWIAANVPTDASIGYDASVLWEDAPGGVKKMANVYRAMMFRTHPRRTVMVHSEQQLKEVDYLYTTKSPEEGLVTIWTNGDYSLHRVSEANGSGAERSG